MGKTITGAISSTVTLVNGDNPVLVNTGAHVAANQIGIYGGASTAWSLTNQGTISATATNPGTANAGILFSNGGSISNASAGVITADGPGIYIGGIAGTVVNAGSIAGVGANSGFGIHMVDGGVVENTAATAAITGYFGGVYIGANGVGTITNEGTISGSPNGGFGVAMIDGGTIVNGSLAATVSSAQIFGGAYGVLVQGGAATVTNYGTIASGTTGYGTSDGVYLRNGGVVTNAANAQIIGYYDGVHIKDNGNGATVSNAGTINAVSQFAGYGGCGVHLDTGTVINGAPGETLATIYGMGSGVRIDGTGTVSNYGTIASGLCGCSTYNGVLIGGGVITNAAGALISGYTAGIYATANPTNVTNFGAISASVGTGIRLMGGGTITNAGMISGVGTAIEFGGSGSNWLVLENGYQFIGSIIGSGSGTNTLQLSGFVAAPLSVNYNALNLSGFQDVLFGSDGHATLAIANTVGTFGLTVSGFDATTEAIDLTGIGTDGTISSFDTINHRLTVSGSGGSVTLQLDGSDATRFATHSDGASGTQLQSLCFLTGTRIRTKSGDVPVQALTVGDRVVTFSGAIRPIAWIGTGRVLATRGRRNAATPVIVRKGALGDNVPYRNLRVTKGHALYLDGVLIPVEELINNRTILWDDVAQEVALYHVELETHDVLIANGAPAESYRDDGNRWLFHNSNSGWELPAQTACAPLLTGGPVVDAVWRRLLDRAGAWPVAPMTSDPDLHLLVDGRRIDVSVCRATVEGTEYRFKVLASCETMSIASRGAVPMEAGTARDPRQLGVAVRQIAAWQGWRTAMIAASDPTLTDGFHDFEPENGFRWTDGSAAVPGALLRVFNGPFELALHVGHTTRYWDDPVAACAA